MPTTKSLAIEFALIFSGLVGVCMDELPCSKGYRQPQQYCCDRQFDIKLNYSEKNKR